MMQPKKSLLACAMAVGLLATFVAPTAAQAAPSCGFYTSGVSAYWKACGTLKEYVHIDKIGWPDDYKCFTPGIHKLGSVVAVRDADYLYACGGI
jgi:hypothetical protein